MIVIVVYDVPTGRTRIYRKLLRRRLEHLQHSVFFGDLSEGQLTELKQQIEGKLRADDSVILFEAGSSAIVEHTTYGSAEEPGSKFT
jgi:CRISPR-associated protein Cas2